MQSLVVVLDVVTILVVGLNLDAMVVDMMRKMDWEDGELPIITWRAMKEAMNSRFVPTNYLRTIYDKLTLLRQGVKTVDEYYMEIEMLMQRGHVRESLEMTMQRFLNGLKSKGQRSCYGSWALHASRAPIYGAGAIDTLHPLLYSA
ncbi:hypothetical protein QYE76_037973 [Lolium multiflorum]|uniref:Retrotransposon gag domain-containing protein n=1 Tax=Lolium multiflorum TaxID=4521 RepID=A0AAD8T733_LOLMU|nr:hypothetical protein QYE76_037973 [Lolium multiflorum]